MTYAVHHHGPRTVAWPVVVGVVPNEPEHHQVRELSGRLSRAFDTNPTVVVGQVLSGLGGVGKTQLAAEYARRALGEGEVDLLVWVPASERMSIVHTYADAARRVVPGWVDDAPERAADQFLSWLRTTDRRWLIVLDNVDVPHVVRGLWPPTTTTPPGSVGGGARGGSRLRSLFPSGKRERSSGPPPPRGRVLITSRRTDTALTGHGRRFVEVGIYSPGEARAYLTRALADLPTPAAVGQIDRLSEELGHLPLALAHAAAYIRDRRGGVTCADYVELLRDRRRHVERLFPEEGSLPDDYPRTVAATWTVSVEHADALTPRGLASPMMGLVALLDPAGIPLRVLTSAPVRGYLHRFREGDEPLTAQDADEALSALERLSLLARTGQGDATLVTAHRLVQRTTREAGGSHTGCHAALAVADALLEEWPDAVHASPYGERLRANTAALAAHAGSWLWDGGGHEVLFRAGTSLGESGATSRAVVYWRSMVATSRGHLGADHPDTLTARERLAFHRGAAGDAAGAVRALEAVLRDRLRVLGPDHPDILTTRGTLALWQGGVGDAAGAVRTLEDLLRDRLRATGCDHPGTVVTRINLAHWRGRAGDAAGAVRAFEEILPECRRVLGADGPDTLSARGVLAHWQGETGDHPGAVRTLEELLPDLSRVFGADHPNTLTSRVNLALWRGRGGDTAGAVGALEGALPDLLRVLGPDHPSTLDAQENLVAWREA
ncbi:tetratricopeptide repeat protein [Nocardiopsis sp. NPDC006938]|uniref:tetratricopeptide repeat protein n=1 Tax=Nocardiopsis sp. NPDC006938 TaxID=3364337 RepID=UPI0036CDED97